MSRLGATLADLQAKLMTGTSDSTSPVVPIRVDVRSEVVQQVDGVTNTAGSNNALPSVHGVNGVNGCSTSVSDCVKGCSTSVSDGVNGCSISVSDGVNGCSTSVSDCVKGCSTSVSDGVNGCSTSVSYDVFSVVNQPNSSCSHGNVNATSESHAKSAELCELTLPTFSDSTKQAPVHFIRP